MFVFSVFSFVSNVISIIANLLQIHTFYNTRFSKEIRLIRKSYHSSCFWGNKYSVFLMNKTLHSLPIQEIFILSKYNDIFYRFEIYKKDDPIIIESMHIKKIESEPYTEIKLSPANDICLNEGLFFKNVVVGVKTVDNEIDWIKPVNRTLLKEAKNAYKNNNCNPVFLERESIDGKILSPDVDCLINLRLTDINGQYHLKTFCGITGYDDGKTIKLSEELKGYNAIPVPENTEKDISETLQKMLGIDENSISVKLI